MLLSRNSKRGRIWSPVLFSALLTLSCRFAVPASFLDEVKGSIRFSNLRPVTTGNAGVLYSGVITGTFEDGAGGVQFSVDGGAFAHAVRDAAGQGWKFYLKDARGDSWKAGSRHTLRARICDTRKTCTTKVSVEVLFTLEANRDINGDGVADIVVGASGNQGTGIANKGAAYVFYGVSGDGIAVRPLNAATYACSGPPDCTVVQNPAEEAGNFGSAAAIIGDVNRDGFADIAVSALENHGTGLSGKGAVYIFYGSPTGIVGHPTNNLPYTCSGFPDCSVIQNPEETASGYFGKSIAYAGDVNGDGIDDFIVGARANKGVGGSSNSGVAYVFYGSEAGIESRVLNATTYQCTAPLCTTMSSPIPLEMGNFGWAVSGGADINKDGFVDIIIAAPYVSGTGSLNKGAVYVFYGSRTGITPHPTAAAYSCSGPPDCTVIQNPNDANGTGFGSSVSQVGDTNGDGFPDLLIGALYNKPSSSSVVKGAAYIFYGSAQGITPHPLSVSAYACSGPPDCTIVQSPEDINTAEFGSAVSDAGDVNGDGYADVIVGASRTRGLSTPQKGAVYIYYGGPAGIALHDFSATAYVCNGPPDCTVIQNPENLLNGNFGISVRFGGDINNDGFGDIIVGASGNAGSGSTGKGGSYIFYGSNSGIAGQPLTASTYNCTGIPYCTVIQNPENETYGVFGQSVGFNLIEIFGRRREIFPFLAIKKS